MQSTRLTRRAFPACPANDRNLGEKIAASQFSSAHLQSAAATTPSHRTAPTPQQPNSSNIEQKQKKLQKHQVTPSNTTTTAATCTSLPIASAISTIKHHATTLIFNIVLNHHNHSTNDVNITSAPKRAHRTFASSSTLNHNRNRYDHCGSDTNSVNGIIFLLLLLALNGSVLPPLASTSKTRAGR